MPEPKLTVVSYNLRVDAGPREPSQSWGARLPLVLESIRRLEPDFLGTQEGLISQLEDLRLGLPGYRFLGQGREGGREGEFAAIFYRADCFARLEEGDFWLSDTPDTPGSSTWGNRYRRMVTWGRFFDLRHHRELLVLNTHWDHEVPAAREKSAALMRHRVAHWPTDLPVVVTGDFNAVAGTDPAYGLMVGDGFFQDTWAVVAARQGDPTLDTFHDFHAPRHESRRIDWILTRGPLSTVGVQIVGDSFAGRFPSDHFPVVARLDYT
jgi:endonuclease/exonuclease/phosphatase family metal-dependent hydrolase